MIVDRNKIQNNKAYDFNFYINDIGLPIDPVNIQVYKEGLSYSYKTLRTKSSAKVVSGNGVLHVSLSLVFDEESTLHLHRLVCQLKNSPFVQIENTFIANSIMENANGYKPDVIDEVTNWFTLSSFQISPMPESPKAYVCELDLRYFNHKPYQYNLTFKDKYQTIQDARGDQYTFSIYKGLPKVLLSKSTPNVSNTRRNVNLFEDLIEVDLIDESASVRKARNSDAYVRYCNFLQVKSLLENFEINEKEIRAILEGTKVEGIKERCLGLHDERFDFQKRKKIINLMGNNTDISYSYNIYHYLPFDGELLKKFRKKLLEGIKEGDSLDTKKKKFKKNREDFMKKKDKDEDLQNIAVYIDRMQLHAYSDLPEHSFIYYEKFARFLQDKEVKGDPKTGLMTVANFSGMFRNILSTIPILGQEFPTHQFLGSIEPVYQLTVLGKVTRGDLGNTSLVNRELERLRKILQENSRSFKMIPDAGYFSCASFITRLLGNYENIDFNVNRKRLTLTSLETKTVEGSPGVDATSLRFCESKTYEVEKLRPAFSSSEFTTSDQAAKALNKNVKQNKVNRPTKLARVSASTSNKYKKLKWNTKYINSDKWYKKIKRRRSDFNKHMSTRDGTMIDINSFNFCKLVVDGLGDYLNWPSNIFDKAVSFFVTSSLDIINTPNPGRPTLSQHFMGTAADFKVSGIEGEDLLKLEAAVYFLWKKGYFNSDDFDNKGGIFVKAYCNDNNNFIHIDKRLKVKGEAATYKKENGKKVVDTSGNIDLSLFEPLSTNLFYYKSTTGENLKTFKKDFIENNGGFNSSKIEENIDEFLKAIKFSTTSVANATTVSESDFSVEEEEANLNVGLVTGDEERRSKLLNKRNPFENDSFEDIVINQETTRYSDLTKQQKVQLKSNLKITEEELKKITYEVIEVDTSSLKSIQKELKGFDNFTIANSGSTTTTIIVPRSSRNINQRNINEDDKVIVKMLEDFNIFASAILTEPELYKDSKDVEAELKRIQNELYGEEVRPFLYTNTLISLVGKKAFEKAVVSAGNMNAGKKGVTGIVTGAAGAYSITKAVGAIIAKQAAEKGALAFLGPLVVLALGIVGGALGASSIFNILEVRNSLIMQFGRFSHNFKKDENLLSTIFSKIIKNPEIKSILDAQPNIYNNDAFLQIMESITDSVAINSGSQAFLQYIVLESPFLKTYNEYQKDLKTYTNVFAALGGFVEIDKSSFFFMEDIQEETVLALSADMLFAGEIKHFFVHAFDFPSEIYFKTDSLVRTKFVDDTYSKVISEQLHYNNPTSFTPSITFILDNQPSVTVQQEENSAFDGSSILNPSKNNFVFNTSKKVLSQYDKDKLQGANSFIKNFYDPKPTSLIPLSKEKLEELNDRKIGYLKNLYQELVKAVKSSKRLRKIYNLNKKTYIPELQVINENCYPDIVLPKSPVGTNQLVHPGFYFYEKNNLGTKNLQKAKKNIKAIVENSFEFSNDLQLGLYTGDHSQIQEVNSNEHGVRSKIPVQAITIDIQEGGPQTIERREEAKGKTTIVKQRATKKEKPSKSINANVSNGTKREDIIKRLDNIVLGRKGYKNKTEDTVEKIQKKLSKLEEGNDTTGLVNYLTGKDENLNISKETLLKKAEDSFSTILNTRDSIKKAFPTFKLYLIEEDSNESDNLLIFDDFYSYNSVIDFSVHKSRKLPADTATVRVQNISGLLDGTKKHVIRDVDIAGNLLPAFEDAEQDKVQSIVVRPGVNAQIRVGYDSNPNNLKIVFCGRITEVAQSGSSDTLELTLQSFGVELVAKKYGVSEADPTRAVDFTSTQQLLSTLALSQELRHFGRYKRGRKFLIGENKQGYLDTTEYLTESWLQLNYSNWVSNFYSEHWLSILGAVVAFELLAGPAAKFFPKISISSGTSGFLNYLSKGGAQINSITQRSMNVIAIGASRFKYTQAAYEAGIAALKYTGRGIKGVGSGIKTIGGKIFQTFSYRSFYRQHQQAIETALQTTLLGPTGGIPSALVRNNSLLGIGNFGGFIKRVLNISGNTTVTREQLIAIVGRAEGAYGLVSRGLVPASRFGLGKAGIVFNSNVIYKIGANYTRTFVVSFLISGIVDLFSSLLGIVNSTFDKFLSYNLNPTKTKFLLSPQDDNIFAPPGERYIRRYDQNWVTELFAGYIYNGIRDTLSYSSVPMGLLLKAGESGYEKYKEFLKHPAVLGNKMLNAKYKENIYNLNNTTIWEVFHEMYLRHPGWVYGVKQYGKGLEQRLFFGLPDQYYYCGPLSNDQVDTLNDIYFKVIEPKRNKVNVDDLTSITGKEVDKSNVDTVISELKNYFIDKVKSYRKPYRNYHHLTSENDIVSNNLILKSESTYNSIVVQYADRTREGRNPAGMHIDNTRTVNAHPFIPKDRMRQKSLVLPNIKGFGGAARYGIGALLDSAKEMYQGSILVLGDPNIEPWDVCILEDNYSMMHGPIEVESVTHIFSYDTGFVTDIKPNALVSSNEAFNQPILDTAPVFIAQKKLLKNEINFNLLRNNVGEIDFEKIKDYVRDSLRTYLAESDSKLDQMLWSLETSIGGTFPELKNKLTRMSGVNVPRGLKYDTLINVYSEIIKKQIDKKQLVSTGELTRGIDVSSYIEELISIGSVAIGGLGVGGVGYSAASTAFTAGKTGLQFSKNIKNPLLLGSLIGLGIAGRYFAKDLSVLANNQLLTGSLANNLFGDMLLARVNEANAIRVYPVSKDSKPLIASGYENIPPQYRFKRMFGKYINVVSDAAVSMSSRIRELEEIANNAGYKEFDNSVIGITKRTVVTVLGGFLGIIGNENYAHIAAASFAELVSGGRISESAAWAYLAQDEFSRINDGQ